MCVMSFAATVKVESDLFWKTFDYVRMYLGSC